MEEPLDPGLIAGLLGLIAHDLRNPLSALHSNVSYIGGAVGEGDEEVREAIADAIVSCEALGHVVDNMELLGYGITSARPRAFSPVGLSSLVNELLAEHRGLAQSHGSTLVFDGAGRSEVVVMVDRDLFRRALGNLLRNSIQHSPSRSVSLTIATTDDEASLVVADPGPPLDPALSELAFRVEGQLAVKSSLGGRYGRGLGLYCARIAATLAGARVAPVAAPAGMSHAVALTARRS